MSVSLKSAFRALPLTASIALAGCFGGGDPDPSPEGQALGVPGDFEICSYEANLENESLFQKNGSVTFLPFSLPDFMQKIRRH